MNSPLNHQHPLSRNEIIPVAATQNSDSPGGGYSHSSRWALLIIGSLLLALTALPASANPTGGVVQAGNITITDVAGLTTITQGDMRGIVNWQDFSIGALETTRFIQPSSGAATLNRVTGGLPSNIHGALEANGHVFLINPNGVLVGAQGRVNTAGFVASSLNVPDGEFLSGGDMTFSGPSLAGVVNLGTITASHGDVVLMARSVENEGTISAPNGTAGTSIECYFSPAVIGVPGNHSAGVYDRATPASGTEPDPTAF